MKKFCIDCKYFIEPQKNVLLFLGKCYLYPKENKEKHLKPDYYHCISARKYQDMCGYSGKQFVKKENLFK